jgi:hypothetical protein
MKNSLFVRFRFVCLPMPVLLEGRLRAVAPPAIR